MNNHKTTILNFIGIGSAFNPQLGNNNAFLVKDDKFILIDCGGLTFSKLLKLNLLENINYVNIIITHTHTDHIGSLADLIFYVYYVKKIVPNIYFPDSGFIITFLRCVGVEDSIYKIYNSKKINIEFGEDNFIVNFKVTDHVPSIPCYSLIINYSKETIFYSGDSKNLPEDILDKLKNGDFDYVFQDVSGANYPGNVHMPFQLLCDKIPEKLRSIVFCMHYDQALKISDITDAGFNLVKIYGE